MKISIISFSQSGYRLSEMLYWVLKERSYHLSGTLGGKELAFGVLKDASHHTPDLPCGKP